VHVIFSASNEGRGPLNESSHTAYKRDFVKPDEVAPFTRMWLAFHIGAHTLNVSKTPLWAPLQSQPMFAARLFNQNTASAASVDRFARAQTIKTTTIKG